MDEYAASVFHSMRIAEYGLRALAIHIDPNAKPEKLEWGPIIRDLNQRIEELNDPKQNPDPDRQAKLDFFSEAVAQCRFFKRWRNDVMHTRGYYEEPEALQVLTHIEDFLRFLAKNEMKLPPSLPA